MSDTTDTEPTTDPARRDIRGAETNLRTIRDRFGGADAVAGILGMFAALGVLVFLGALLAAGAGQIPYQLNQLDVDGNLQDVEVVGSLVAIAVVFVAFLVGGWAAGRIARYDGAINGVGVALWFILLVAIFGLLGVWFGTEFNAFRGPGLPDWFAQIGTDDVTLKAIAGAAAGIVAALLGGGVGGMMGEQYNRRVDAALIGNRVVRAVDGPSLVELRRIRSINSEDETPLESFSQQVLCSLGHRDGRLADGNDDYFAVAGNLRRKLVDRIGEGAK